MSFLAPGFLIAAGAIAVVVTLLHFIVTREPNLFRLPTARFAPERAIQARARAISPTDLLLLAIRVGLILSVGAALAGPVFSPPRRPLARIVLLDGSRALADPREAADSARSLLETGDVLIRFDSAARIVEGEISDSLGRWAASAIPGRLSTALIAALRTGSRIRKTADSIELILVSPLLREEIDAATDSIRALWPARVRVVRVAAARPGAGRPRIIVDGAPADPLRLALPPGQGDGPAAVRIVRRAASGADSLWARESGGVLVEWPVAPEIPGRWASRAPDSIGAVVAGGAVVVAPFSRTVRLGGEIASAAVPPRNDSGPPARPTRVIARWVDGEAAATETVLGSGCLRTVTIPVPSVGDLVLAPRFERLVAVLAGGCGDPMDPRPADDAQLNRLTGTPGPARALAASFAIPERLPSPWTRWLLALAILLLGVETVLRRSPAR